MSPARTSRTAPTRTGQPAVPGGELVAPGGEHVEVEQRSLAGVQHLAAFAFGLLAHAFQCGELPSDPVC